MFVLFNFCFSIEEFSFIMQMLIFIGLLNISLEKSLSKKKNLSKLLVLRGLQIV